MPDILRAAHVTLRHAGAQQDAVRDVGFSISKGERIALLGPSGSGKTSLALALAGAIPALVPGSLSGSISWPQHGVPADGVMAGIGACAMVMQNAEAQLVALGVADEIAFALENRGLAPSEIDARVARALAHPPALGLNPDDRTLPLSSGWRQRLSLAAAMAEQSDLLIVDEPVAHLDETAAGKAMTAVGAACAQGASALIIEHRADHAAMLAERVLVLDRNGNLGADGPAHDIFAALALQSGHGLRLPAWYDLAAALLRTGRLTAIPESEEVLMARCAAIPGAARIAAACFGFDRPRTAPGPPLLAIDNARVRRGGRAVLDGVSLAIGAGEILGVAGPNGAGKTSLGLLAAGGLAPKPGRVAAGGDRRPIFLPQNPAPLFASASLADEAARRGLAFAELANWLSRLGLEADPLRHPLAHSYGEMRRIGLALALADDRPGLMVLDEPTAGLDADGLAALGEALATLAGRGCAVLVISHDLDWLGAQAHRIAVMERGRIVADAPAASVLAGALAGRLPLGTPPRARLAAASGWSFAL